MLLPKLAYPVVSLSSQLEAIGSASPVNVVVNLHCDDAVIPFTKPLVNAVPPLATGVAPVNIFATSILLSAMFYSFYPQCNVHGTQYEPSPCVCVFVVDVTLAIVLDLKISSACFFAVPSPLLTK